MNIYPHPKVLITGGAGFIGSHLVETCLAQELPVVVLDNFSTGLRSNIPEDSEHVTIIDGSILDASLCDTAMQGVTCVFHLAAQTSVPASVHDPLMCYETNIRGTYNILEAARRNNVQHFVFSSSAAVYGAFEGLCREDETPCSPESPYGTSKWIGEQLCKEYGKLYGIRTVCLRYFNVYGSRQRTDLPHTAFVATIMHKMRYNEPIVIYGNGLHERDFVPVERAVQANMKMGKLLINNAWYGETMNIASGASQTLRHMIEHLHAQFPDYDLGKIHFAPERPGDVKYSAAYCEKYSNVR